MEQQLNLWAKGIIVKKFTKKSSKNIITSARLTWALEVKIRPIHSKFSKEIGKKIGLDSILNASTACINENNKKITSIKIESNGFVRGDGFLDEIAKRRIADIMDEYIDEVGGYAQVQA